VSAQLTSPRANYHLANLIASLQSHLSEYLPAVHWQGTKFAVCLSGYRYLGEGGTVRREILRDGTCVSPVSRICLLPFWGGIPKQPQMKAKNGHFWQFWPTVELDSEYLEDGKSERYMAIRV